MDLRKEDRTLNHLAEDTPLLMKYTSPKRSNQVEDTRKQIGRRAFLMAGGLAAASGAAGSVWAFMRGNGAKRRTRRRALWIKNVNRPTLGDRGADYKRFSGNDMFALYSQLKTQREGEGSFEAEQASKTKRLTDWIGQKKPGYSLPDHQLSEGAWTLMHSVKPGAGLLSWTRISVPTPATTAASAPRRLRLVPTTSGSLRKKRNWRLSCGQAVTQFRQRWHSALCHCAPPTGSSPP